MVEFTKVRVDTTEEAIAGNIQQVLRIFEGSLKHEPKMLEDFKKGDLFIAAMLHDGRTVIPAISIRSDCRKVVRDLRSASNRMKSEAKRLYGKTITDLDVMNSLFDVAMDGTVQDIAEYSNGRAPHPDDEFVYAAIYAAARDQLSLLLSAHNDPSVLVFIFVPELIIAKIIPLRTIGLGSSTVAQ